MRKPKFVKLTSLNPHLRTRGDGDAPVYVMPSEVVCVAAAIGSFDNPNQAQTGQPIRQQMAGTAVHLRGGAVLLVAESAEQVLEASGLV